MRNDFKSSVMETPSRYIFVFYNPLSGSRQGEHLKRLGIQNYRVKTHFCTQVQLYDLLENHEKESGLRFIEKLYKETSVSIVIYAAGGDGTFSGLLKDLTERVDMTSKRIISSPISFGTGNGLGTLIWNSRTRMRDTRIFEKFNKLITDRLDCPIKNFDIWKVKITAPNGKILQNSKSGSTSSKIVERVMTTYISFGIQGKVGYAFETHRHSKRILNFLEYTKQALISTKITLFHKYVNNIEYQAEKATFKNSDKKLKYAVELIVQNIKGMWGSKVSLWNECELTETVSDKSNGPTDSSLWSHQDMGDGKLEIFAIRNRVEYVKNLFKSTRKSILRIGQFSDFTLNFQKNTYPYAMLDGEFFHLECPEKMEIKLLGSIQVFVNK